MLMENAVNMDIISGPEALHYTVYSFVAHITLFQMYTTCFCISN